jgi:hypothetical protein
MALGVRFVALHSMIYANGKAFPATVGSTIDIAFPDADAVQSDQATRLMIVGATADRPVNAGRDRYHRRCGVMAATRRRQGGSARKYFAPEALRGRPMRLPDGRVLDGIATD